MRWLVWLIALFALAVAVSLGARMNDGYVLVIFPPWRMEISLNLFIVLLLAVLFVGYGLLRGVFATLSLPARAREYRQRRQQEKAFQTLHDSLLLMQEGRFGQAMKKAADAWQAGAAPGLSALVAARAAQRMREPAKQRSWIERAKQSDERAEAAAWMLEAEMCNDQRDFDGSLQILQRFQAKYGRHLAALRLELRARQGTGDWDGVLRLIRQLEKRSALSREAAHEIRLSAHLANIVARSGDAAALLAYLKDVPGKERDARLALAVARELHALGEDDRAADVIEMQLDDGSEARWHVDLITLYGMLASSDVTARIARADKWLPGRHRDAHLLLALGRLCCRQRLWGKAQSYLEASLAVGASATAHLELANLFEQLGRAEEANRHLRQSIELTN